MADEEPTAAPRSAASEPDFSRRVVTLGGDVVEYDTPEQAAAALAMVDSRGRPLFTPDSADAREERRLRRAYGNRPLAAGAAGAARGATFGASDAIGAGLGFGEDLRNLEDLNPGASIAGEVVGSVAPVLLAGPLGAAGEAVEGASLLGRAGRLLSAPTRAVAGLAEAGGATARTALRGAGSSLLRRAAGTVGGLATEGAIEGGLGEAGRILTDYSLGRDPDLTAEHILARVGSGALMGAGGGALLGGAGAVLGEGVRASRRAAAGGVDLLRNAWRSQMGTELNRGVAELAGDAGDFLRLSPAGREARAIVARGDEVYDTGTRDVVGALDSLERGRAHAADFWSRGLKRSQVVERVASAPFADQVTSAADAFTRARRFTQRVLGSPGDYAGGTGALARRLDQVIEARDSALARALDRGAGREASADVFQALDELKREVGRIRTNRVIAGSAATSELDELYEGIRTTLERSDLWGEAADVQRAVNAAYTNELSTRRAFSRRFLGGDGMRDDVDPFRTLATADTRPINAFLRQTGTVANETAERTFEQTIEGTRELLRVMDQHLDLPANVRADVAAALSGSESALQTFNRVRQEASVLNQFQRLNGGNAGIVRGIVGSAVGAAVAGPIGAAAAGVASNPTALIRALGAIENISNGMTDQIGSSVRSFLARGTSAGRRAAREGGRRARLATVGGIEAYRARTRQLDEDQRNPREAVSRLAARLDGMEVNPRVRDAVAATSVRGQAYLAAHRPGQRTINGQIRPTLDANPSAEEVAEFLRRARVVDNPQSVLADLRSGVLTPEAVDALRNVYPRLYDQIRETVVRELASGDSPVSYNQRIALGLLMGVPTDPALTPEHMALTQAMFAAPTGAASAPRPGGRPPDLSTGLASGTDALARRTA